MRSRFSEQFVRALAAWITYMQEWLDIRDWQIVLKEDYPDSGVEGDRECAAAVRVIYGRRHAMLYLGKGFFDDDEESQRHYLTHELCHIIADGCDTVVVNCLEDALGKTAYHVFEASWRAQLELMVDNFANVLRGALEDGERQRFLWENVMRAERGEEPLNDQTK